MKQLKFTLLASFITILCSSALYGAEITKGHVPPPDSSSSIMDRTAALYLIEEGKEFFNQGMVKDAMRKFREAYVRDKFSYKAAYWIGETHYEMDNYGYALKYAKIAERLSEAAEGEVFLLLGKAYHRQSYLDSASMNYDLAKIQLSSRKQNVFNIQQLIDEVKFAKNAKKDTSNFERKLLGDYVNSGHNDYAVTLFNDGKELFFVSRRPGTTGGNINPSDQQYFEDIYYSKWDDETKEWTSPTNDVKHLNSDGFDAIGDVSKDGNTAYLTVNTSVIETKNPTRSSDICVSERTKKDRWSTPKPIKNKTINTSFFDGAPTLTADGNTMYFVSDRNGDKTRADIFVVYKDGNKWGEAKALPSIINSKGNETTPFITPDNRYLFFSSDGYVGMGGYDIYVSENLGNEWSKPKNLGPVFNTVNNDTHFKYYKALKKAVLSTYRLQDNKASMDAFEIMLDGWEIP